MRLLLALSLFLRRASWSPAPEWTAADARALATFLATPAGAKLQTILRNEITAANERAAMKAAPFECGWACGYRGLFAWFQSLSQPADSPAEPDPEIAAGLEHLFP
jgi:hypothetical protein